MRFWLIFCVTVAGTAFFFWQESRQREAQNAGSGSAQMGSWLGVSETMSVWSARINEAGAETAYQEAKNYNSTQGEGAQHQFVHEFGMLLYEKLGNDGVGVCDDAFAFGCYHGFFGIALVQEGTAALQSFGEACAEKWAAKSMPCLHGIGHGILAYVGKQNLVQALELCLRVSDIPRGGCTSGVFMEYNFSTSDDHITTRIRPLLGEDPHSPCAGLTSVFLGACYQEQPQWWDAVLKGDYLTMGALCAEVTLEAGAQEACFQGIGNYAASRAQYDVAGTIVLCLNMPYEHAQVLCREAAALIFLVQPHPKNEEALELCKGLAADSQQRCIEKVKANPFSS